MFLLESLFARVLKKVLTVESHAPLCTKHQWCKSSHLYIHHSLIVFPLLIIITITVAIALAIALAIAIAIVIFNERTQLTIAVFSGAFKLGMLNIIKCANNCLKSYQKPTIYRLTRYTIKNLTKKKRRTRTACGYNHALKITVTHTVRLQAMPNTKEKT